MKHRSYRHRFACFVVSVVIALGGFASSMATARTISVVGTPHLSALEPAASPNQRLAVVDRLANFSPSLICVEGMPGERVQQFASSPNRHGELLQHFGLTAVQLAPEQQVRLGLDGQAARAAARELERQGSALDTNQRLRLISLQLAAYEPWSALLNWTHLDKSDRGDAAKSLGRIAADRLERLAESGNEVVALAIPLARRSGHRRLCAVDSFVDELTVQSLARDLMPIVSDEDVRAGLDAFAAERAQRWSPERQDGLVRLLQWMNSPEWADRDRETQWDVFDSNLHDAGKRRLMLWHARNAEMLSWLFRNLGEPDGERVMLIVGGAHRPFLEQALNAHDWLDVVPAESLFKR